MSDYPPCAKCGEAIRDGGVRVPELDEGYEWWECHGCAASADEKNVLHPMHGERISSDEWRTEDGYRLTWNGEAWTNGDLSFPGTLADGPMQEEYTVRPGDLGPDDTCTNPHCQICGEDRP